MTTKKQVHDDKLRHAFELFCQARGRRATPDVILEFTELRLKGAETDADGNTRGDIARACAMISHLHD